MYLPYCIFYHFALVGILAAISKANGALNTNDKHLPEACKDVDSQNLEACDDIEQLNEWANNLPVLKAQDDNIVRYMRDLVHLQENDPLLTDEMVIDHFQLIMALPLQTACHVGKWIALKRWHSNCGSTDGEQYLCMDNFFNDIENKK